MPAPILPPTPDQLLEATLTLATPPALIYIYGEPGERTFVCLAQNHNHLHGPPRPVGPRDRALLRALLELALQQLEDTEPSRVEVAAR